MTVNHCLLLAECENNVFLSVLNGLSQTLYGKGAHRKHVFLRFDVVVFVWSDMPKFTINRRVDGSGYFALLWPWAAL